ncbi:MAG: hypothetical protein V1820_04765 [archaeon]
MKGISDAYFGLGFSELAFGTGAAVYSGEGVKPAELDLVFDRPFDYTAPAQSQGAVSVRPGHLVGKTTDLIIRTGGKRGDRVQYSFPDGRMIHAQVRLGDSLANIEAALIGTGFERDVKYVERRRYSKGIAIAEIDKFPFSPAFLELEFAGVAGDDGRGDLKPIVYGVLEALDLEECKRIEKLFRAVN